MSTVDLEGTSAEQGTRSLGWMAMIKDLLAFAGSRGTETVATERTEADDIGADEDGREGEGPEAVHPILLVHYASPMY